MSYLAHKQDSSTKIKIIILLWSFCATTVFPQTVQQSSTGIQSVSQVQIPPNTRHLDFSHNRIARLVSGDFSQLAELQTLSLRNNNLSVIENGAFRGLVSLRILYLQDNEISQFPDLSELNELRELYLQNNALANLPTTVLLPTSNNVERLDLSRNSFTVVTNGFLRHFTRLKYLNMCCGSLTEAPPVYEIVASLQILDIHSTQISSLEKQSFIGTNTQSNLQELILENNTCTIEAGFFKTLPNLLILNMNQLGFSELPDLTGNLYNLRELHVARNFLRILDTKHFLGIPPDYSQKPGLVSINAASNEITAVSGDLLSALEDLETVDFGFNKLTSFPLSSLSGVTGLKTVILRSNQITTLEDWGRTIKNNLSIDISGNPLDCSDLCWFFQSGYANFDSSSVRSQYPCRAPPSMTVYTWAQLTTSPEEICNAQDSKSSTTHLDVEGNKENRSSGEDEGKGSSTKLEIIIGIAVAVFVVAAIISILSVLKFCVWGRKDPDVILIGQGGLISRKVDSEEKGSVRREQGGGKRSRPASGSGSHSKHRHNVTSRTSRLHTISEKNEETNLDRADGILSEQDSAHKRRNSEQRPKKGNSDRNGMSKVRDGRAEDRPRSSRPPRRTESFERDPTVSQEIPYEFTYRV